MDTQVVSGIQGFMSNGGMLIILMIALFAVMIIPQRKREKKIKDMLANLKPGDRVRTIGGIYGTITAIKDDVVTISVGPDKVRLVFIRGAIASVEDSPGENTIEDQANYNKLKSYNMPGFLPGIFFCAFAYISVYLIGGICACERQGRRKSRPIWRWRWERALCSAS